MIPLAAIVLAAGQSARMGGPNKLLQHINGVPILQYALQTIAELDLAQTIVVTGRDAEAVSAIAERYGASCVHNADAAGGMGGSISSGARAVCCSVDGVFVHLGDVPFVSVATWRALAAALRDDAARAHDVFVPVRNGQRGHPVLFRSSVLAALQNLHGDAGARAVVGAHACQEVAVGDGMILRDIDTPDDLRSASAGIY